MSKKTIVLIAIMLGLGVGAALMTFRAPAPTTESAPTASHVEPREIVIVSDDAPGGSEYAQAALLGAKAAITEINAQGGVDGKPLVARTVASGQEAASLLGAKGTKPLFVLDTSTTTDGSSLARSQELGVLHFFLIDGPCRVLRPGETSPSPSAWSLGLTWQVSVESLFVYLSNRFSRPEKQFGVLYFSGATEQNEAATDFAKDAAESLGFTTIDDLRFDIRTGDYYTTLRNIITRGPDVLFLSNAGPAGRLFIEQAAKLGIQKEMVLSGLQTFDPEISGSLGAALNQSITVSRYVPDLDNAANKKFLATLGAGSKPTPVSAAAYTAVHLAAKAVKKAGAADLGAVAKALSGLELDAPNGKVRMNPTNHILEQEQFVVEAKDGAYHVAESLGAAVHPRLEGCGGRTDG